MTLPVLERIAALAEAGATVIGTAPVADPSLADDPARFRALVVRLWPGGDQAGIGRGRVIATSDLAAGLARAGVTPDVVADGASSPGDILFQHRGSMTAAMSSSCTTGPPPPSASPPACA